MALTKDQKTAQVKDLTDKFKSAESVMFAHYIGMSVAEVSELRSKLKEEEAEMRVAKKTLLKIAAKDSDMPELDEKLLDGPVSMIFSFADPLSGAQVAFKFGKDHNQVELLGGIFDGKVLTKEEAIELAKMPSREQLLGIFATMIRSPLTTFAGMCGSPLGGFARALSGIADKGGFGGDEPAPTAEEPKEEQAEAAATAESQPAPEAQKAEDSAEDTAETPAEESSEPEPEPEPESKSESE